MDNEERVWQERTERILVKALTASRLTEDIIRLSHDLEAGTMLSDVRRLIGMQIRLRVQELRSRFNLEENMS